MSLKSVSVTLSTNGSPPRLTLTQVGSREILQELPLVRALGQHRNFILGTWVKSYRPTARKKGFGEFYDKHEPGIAENRWQDCWVATDEGGYTVYAWVCGSQGDLLHVYVTPELRNKGAANALVLHACGTKVPDIARPWPGNKVFGRLNPYLLTKLRTGDTE